MFVTTASSSFGRTFPGARTTSRGEHGAGSARSISRRTACGAGNWYVYWANKLLRPERWRAGIYSHVLLAEKLARKQSLHKEQGGRGRVFTERDASLHSHLGFPHARWVHKIIAINYNAILRLSLAQTRSLNLLNYLLNYPLLRRSELGFAWVRQARGATKKAIFDTRELHAGCLRAACDNKQS